jgi:hypothetical protein
VWGFAVSRLVVFETLQMHRADASGKVSLYSGLPRLSSQHELQEAEIPWGPGPRKCGVGLPLLFSFL